MVVLWREMVGGRCQRRRRSDSDILTFVEDKIGDSDGGSRHVDGCGWLVLPFVVLLYWAF
jgi:hypothetical protein